MEALVKRDDFAASRIGEARELQRRCVRFRAAVAEERAHHAARANQLFGEDARGRVIEEIRDVQQRVRLIAQRFDEARMTISERVDGDATEKVPILLARGVGKTRAFSAARMK